jgi:hypothetical protein
MAGLKNGNPRHALTVEEARKGGRKSAETRARRKSIREAFEAICSERYTDEHGNEIDGITAMCMQQFQLAMNGDTKAFVEIRNSLGEMPTQRVEVDTIDPQARAEMDELVRKASEL